MHFLISLCETTSEALQNPASCRIDFLPLPLNPCRVDGNISNALKKGREFCGDFRQKGMSLQNTLRKPKISQSLKKNPAISCNGL